MYVHRPRAMECLGGSREEKISRTCCVLGDAGDEDLCPTPPWWGEVKRGGDSSANLEIPNSELHVPLACELL